jgi:hypothetical protein
MLSICINCNESIKLFYLITVKSDSFEYCILVFELGLFHEIIILH